MKRSTEARYKLIRAVGRLADVIEDSCGLMEQTQGVIKGLIESGTLSGREAVQALKALNASMKSAAPLLQAINQVEAQETEDLPRLTVADIEIHDRRAN